MSVGIKCRECGYVNSLGRVFCLNCGKRLDLTRVSKRVLARSAMTAADRRRRARRLLGLLVATVILALALWPIVPQGKVGGQNDVESLKIKVRRLERAVAARAYVFDVISEEEVNAFLAELVRQDAAVAKPEGFWLRIETIRVNFTPDELKVFLLATWGPLRFSYVVAGIPEIRNRRFDVNLNYGRLGHLWLPVPVASWLGARIAHAFSELKRERRLLDELGRCELGDEKVRLVTRRK